MLYTLYSGLNERVLCPAERWDWWLAGSVSAQIFLYERLTYVLTSGDQGGPLTRDFSTPVPCRSEDWLGDYLPSSLPTTYTVHLQSCSSEIWPTSASEEEHQPHIMKMNKDIFFYLCVSSVGLLLQIICNPLPCSSFNNPVFRWTINQVLKIWNIFSFFPSVAELKGFSRIFWWWSQERQLQRGHR